MPNSFLLLVTTLLQEAEPAAEQAAEKSAPSFWIPMIGVFLVFWFLLIQPQRKEQKKREAMLSALKKNDDVMTSSGIYGRVVQIQDDVVTLQVAEGVRIRFNRAAVQNINGPTADKDKEKETAKA